MWQTAICCSAIVPLAVLLAYAASPAAIPIEVENRSGAAADECVSAGVPFAKGALRDAGTLALSGARGRPVALQTKILSRWPDGSARWVLADFPAGLADSTSSTFTLSTGGKRPTVENGVNVAGDGKSVRFSNGIVEFSVKTGEASGTLASADGNASAEMASIVEIGGKEGRVTSKVVIDALEVYADGPVRAAVSIRGRRLYSDGIEGPFSQRVEMFAGSPYVRVEDTFVYAHFPGTHAEPEHPLALWKIQTRVEGDAKRLAVASLMYPEEAESLLVSPDSVAFWGLDKPFDLSRHTDEELIGEDTPGIALGVGKSAAALVGLLPSDGTGRDARPRLGVYAHTAPEVYAASKALGSFAPETPGRFEAAEEGIRQVLGFWMFYQDHDPKGVFGRGPWHGLFDWGDWQCLYTDQHGKPTGWQYHNGRYGWDCNEMDTTLMLWHAFIHTSRPGYWRAAVAMSRHTMDVDMINVDYRNYQLPDHVYDPHSYGAPWKEGVDRLLTINTIGLGRRHNVQHWGNGVGDTRHTWNGGIMMYYYLTGNRRAHDAVIAMADMHMQRIWGYACGEYTLSLWCLYNAWQMTGEEKYLDEFKYRLDVIAGLRLPDKLIPEHLDFDKKATYPDVDHEGGGMGLALDYISNALADYYADTQDVVAKDILVGLAERELSYGPVNLKGTYQPLYHMRALAFAYEVTGDKRFLKQAADYLSVLEAKPMPRQPETDEEWFRLTYDVNYRQAWQIRHVGPGIRMAPYVMQTISDSEKAEGD